MISPGSEARRYNNLCPLRGKKQIVTGPVLGVRHAQLRSHQDHVCAFVDQSFTLVKAPLRRRVLAAYRRYGVLSAEGAEDMAPISAHIMALGCHYLGQVPQEPLIFSNGFE